MKDKIGETLNIAPIDPPKRNQMVATPVTQNQIAPVPVPEPAEDPDSREDYTLSRTVYKDLILKGAQAIDDISLLAKDLESPRAYEVLATMIKTVSESTRDLYDLHKKKKDLRTDNSTRRLDETNITVDKAVFVGTTADLLKRVKHEVEADGS